MIIFFKIAYIKVTKNLASVIIKVTLNEKFILT